MSYTASTGIITDADVKSLPVWNEYEPTRRPSTRTATFVAREFDESDDPTELIEAGIQSFEADAAAELMAVPYLQARYGRAAPERSGLKHPSIAAYGAFTCSDGREVVLAVQNDREWQAFCQHVLQQPELAQDPRYLDSPARSRHRDAIEVLIQSVIGSLPYGQTADRLTEAKTPFGSINTVFDLIHHPQLRTRQVQVRGRTVEMPAPACIAPWQQDLQLRSAPGVNEHDGWLQRE